MDTHDGKLPIQDQVDVISVGTSFLRFLELADKLQIKVAVVTDNDGDISAVEEKYSDFLGEKAKSYIRICYDKTVDGGPLTIGGAAYNYNTLEPKMLKANGNNVALFNAIFGTEYSSLDDLRKYMKHHKTDCALAIFKSDTHIAFPDYIMEAIKDE